MNNTTNQRSDSILRMLRGLVPQRRLTASEALRIAELQANRLLEHFDITEDWVPNDLILTFPRVDVRLQHDLPVSGSTHWESGRWVITINADEPWARRRFSLMHEFKHVLDHSMQQYLYGDVETDDKAAERAERAADHFAACLLMPKRRLKSLWFENRQHLSRTAALLGVSNRALSVRLYYLGLAPEKQRCARNLPSAAFGRPAAGRSKTMYFRTKSLVGAVA